MNHVCELVTDLVLDRAFANAAMLARDSIDEFHIFEIVRASGQLVVPLYQLRSKHVQGFSLDVAADRKLTMCGATATVRCPSAMRRTAAMAAQAPHTRCAR